MNAITSNDVVTQLRTLLYKSPVYIWGANGEKITPESIDALKSRYISKHCTEEYYDEKLAEHRGKCGIDDVGIINFLSGENFSIDYYIASAYQTVPAIDITKNFVWMLYGTRLNGTPRVGMYLGNGNVITISEHCGMQEVPLGTVSVWFDQASIPNFITDGANVPNGVSAIVECYQRWLDHCTRVCIGIENYPGSCNGHAAISGYYTEQTLVLSRAVAKQLYGNLTGISFDKTADITMDEIRSSLFVELRKNYKVTTYEQLMYIISMRLYNLGLLPEFVSAWGTGDVVFETNFGERLRGMQCGLKRFILHSRYLDCSTVNMPLLAELFRSTV